MQEVAGTIARRHIDKIRPRIPERPGFEDIDILARRGYLTMTPRGLPASPARTSLGQRTAPGEVVVVAAASHNFKSVTSPTDPGFAGPLSPAMADTLTRWLARTLGA